MKVPLSVQFFSWIFGGLFFIVAAFGITWYSVCSGPSQYPTVASPQQNERGDQLRHLIDESIWRAITQSNQTNAANKIDHAQEAKPNPRLLSVICDAKITDWALAFFTYALVIVGWFGIKSSAQSTRDMERALCFGGPYRPNFTGQKTIIEVAIENYGRSPAIVKEVYGEFAEILPTSKVPIYDRSKGKSIAKDDTLAPRTDTMTIQRPQYVVGQWESSIQTPHFFFGYFRYIDIFRIEHLSRYCHTIDPVKYTIEDAGGDARRDWN